MSWKGVRRLGFAGLVCLSGCGSSDEEAVERCPVPAARSTDGEPFAFTALALRSPDSCGLGNDGSLRCWESLSPLSEPTRVEGVTQALAVTMDELGPCVARDGGSVFCWMDDFDGETVPNLCGATAITENRCALVDGGNVRCWHGNPALFGDDKGDIRVSTVSGVSGAVSLGSGPNDYTCASLEDGSVMCWGGGPRSADRPGVDPATVPEVTGARSVVGAPNGASYDEKPIEMCALLEDGGVTCWTRARAPEPIVELANVVSLSLSRSHGCAVLADGSAHCWGANATGQLGNGTTEASATPVPVEGLSDVVHVATGSLDSSFGHSCAIVRDGSAWCWGFNQFGEDDFGTTDGSSVPVAVPAP